MMVIMLYGALGRQFGKVHRYDVKSPREAVRALCATLPGFRKTVEESGHYRVSVAGLQDLELEETAYPVSHKESVRIIPVVEGAGGGFGKILLGAALIAFSVAFPTFGMLPFTSGPLAGMSIGSIAGSIGMSLLLGGVAQMLFAPPKQKSGQMEKAENRPSFMFDGAINTSAQGNPVPVCYGELIVGSQVVSAGLTAEQI